MAVNISRSQRMDLLEGATDGKYRKVRPNTSAVVGSGNEQTLAGRQHLHPDWNYDFIDREVPLAQRVVPGC
jgi:hypothetical protein